MTSDGSAPAPFIFRTSVESIQLTGRKAANLAELHAGLREAEGSTIYHHTHRFYRAHSFLGAWNRSDFALWAANNLKEEALAERMAALDTRDYPNLEALKQALLETLAPLEAEPDRWQRKVPAGLEFHFCKSISLVFPAGYEAKNLEDFLEALERVDLASLYFHLIESPLHAHGRARPFANDFSNWLAELGFEAQAKSLAELNPYSGDLESLRTRALGLFRKNRFQAAVHRAVGRVERESAGEAASHWLQRWRTGGVK
ncbi:MAG TPA: DUF5752 family protein [bacterium]|nr:DUF5752 family protein [bacterium]